MGIWIRSQNKDKLINVNTPKYTTPMLQPIFFERIKPIKPIKDTSSIENSINYDFNVSFIKINERINDMMIKKLYEIYKDTNIDELIVIDEVQFKDFLSKYIPLYVKNDCKVVE